MYVAASVAASQLSVGFTATPMAPSAGDERVGTAGNAIIVVKLRVAEKSLVPAEFVALTRQKYCALFESAIVVANDVAVRPV